MGKGVVKIGHTSLTAKSKPDSVGAELRRKVHLATIDMDSACWGGTNTVHLPTWQPPPQVATAVPPRPPPPALLLP